MKMMATSFFYYGRSFSNCFLGTQMAFSFGRVASAWCFLFFALSASLVFAPAALADPEPPVTEMTITPVDDDEYLPADDVTALHELDAIRRHVSDLKALVLFGTGFIGICILCQKLF